MYWQTILTNAAWHVHQVWWYVFRHGIYHKGGDMFWAVFWYLSYCEVWHVLWHIVWLWFWYVFWHVFCPQPSILTFALPSSLPLVPAYALKSDLALWMANAPTFSESFFLTFYLALSGISSDILSGISFGISIWHSQWCARPCVPTLTWRSLWCSGLTWRSLWCAKDSGRRRKTYHLR